MTSQYNTVNTSLARLARATIRQSPQLLAPGLLLLAYAYLVHLYHLYDWGHAFTKLLVFVAMAAIIIFLSKQTGTSPTRPHTYWLESIFLFLVLLLVIDFNYQQYSPFFSKPPFIDIGYSTQNAAIMLFHNHQNPYQNTTISQLEDNPDFWGYKYGPTMIAGYAASAFFPQRGFKFTNLLYLTVTIIVLILLSYNRQSNPLKNIATAAFAVTLTLLPKRLWYELFQQGVNDIFPILLILISLVSVKGRRWFWAGLAAGLSFSAKFAPAIFFIILFIRKDFKTNFFKGVALGSLPLLIFLIWDSWSLINNIFIFHAIKHFDSTSLYSLAPKALHFWFPLIQILATLYVVFVNFKRRIHYQALTVHFTLLFIIIELTYKEIHGNHLVLFIPLIAIILAWYRYRLLRQPARHKTTTPQLARPYHDHL